MPERRVMRYATIDAAQVKAQAEPTEAEIAQAFAADKARYAPSEQRTVTLVTVLDENAASALVARIKGGQPIADAARGAGLEARKIVDAQRQTIAAQTSAAVADAIFAAPQGSVLGPLRASIGFVLARVDSVTRKPGRTLAQAHDELAAKVRAQKATAAIGKLRDSIEDSLADNASLNEVVKDQKLTAVATGALLSTGVDPDRPGVPADPALAAIVQAGFAAEEGDTPVTVPLGQDGSFAVVGLDRIVRAAPVPLADIRPRVVADVQADRARRTARQRAEAVLQKVNGGMALPAALAAAGVKGPPVQSLTSTRAQLNADPRGVNPVLALLFSIPQNSARMLESPENKGWLIVRVNQIVPGDASRQPGVVNATRSDLGRSMGREYAEQFAQAIVTQQGAKRNKAAIEQLKKELAGAGGPQQ
jgi:peptidyl-prolyl cis-trans isomerase D